MKAVTRSTLVGLFVYAGLSLAGWLAMTSRLGAAYGVVFIVCIVGVLIGQAGNNDEQIVDKINT
jgi:hypothetical protein